jgi:hypothetical protein
MLNVIYPDYQTAGLLAQQRQAGYLQEKAHERLCRPLVELRRQRTRRRLRQWQLTFARAATLARFRQDEGKRPGQPAETQPE